MSRIAEKGWVKMVDDNREFSRYKPRDNMYASLGSNLNQVGKVIDISPGGLSFEFISDSEASESARHVDIFLLDEETCIKTIPCRLVYQASTVLPGIRSSAHPVFKLRRCGLMFGSMIEEQWEQLTDFMEYYASGETCGIGIDGGVGE